MKKFSIYVVLLCIIVYLIKWSNKHLQNCKFNFFLFNKHESKFIYASNKARTNELMQN